MDFAAVFVDEDIFGYSVRHPGFGDSLGSWPRPGAFPTVFALPDFRRFRLYMVYPNDNRGRNAGAKM